MEARAPREPRPVRAILPKRLLREEVAVVLALSLFASAVYAVINLLSAPISGVAVSIYRPVQLASQVADIVFGLAPVWLVWHLVKRSGEGAGAIGLAWDRPRFDLARAAGIAAIVGAAGIGVYLAAVALDVNRIVVPVPPTGHWWTVPILLVGSAQNALLEEAVVVGYLVTRLGQLGWSPPASVVASAGLRATYHLYQGWGGFAGNLAMGLFFGWLFTRWRRTWPLVMAHALVDIGAGVGYLLFRDHLPSL